VRPRDVVDHALRRRARLMDYAAGRVSSADICDAHPYLQLAARHYGERTAHSCPVCQKPELRHVHYVYGDALGNGAGQAKSSRELRALDARYEAFDVYVVEVCRDCGWNHLIRSYGLGSRGELPDVADG
jgi:hypothetical protein